MTFRSLYRLERRGLLELPVVGVAVNDWNDDQLREHARDVDRGPASTVDDAVFERLAARLSTCVATSRDPATYSGRRGPRARQGPVFYSEIPPFLFGRSSRASPAPA